MADLTKDTITQQSNFWKNAGVTATASGNTQVVAAVPGKIIRVITVVLNNADASTVKIRFQSATTNITDPQELSVEGGGFAKNEWPGFYCETAVGEALNLNLSGAGDVGGKVGYILV